MLQPGDRFGDGFSLRDAHEPDAGGAESMLHAVEILLWNDHHVQHTLGAPGIRLMSVAQAEAIAKTVPGLKHVVLWRGLIDLSRDIPNSDVDLLASRNRLLVRKDLHPALQYLLLEAADIWRGLRSRPFCAVAPI